MRYFPRRLAVLIIVAALCPLAFRLYAEQEKGRDEKYAIRKDVNLVLLPTSVLDKSGHFVTNLKEKNFTVLENNVEQKLSVFRRENAPITVGLVIDNSGSMRNKRDRVNAAALAFVKASGRPDEVFVVNFNDEFYFDLDHDFTNNLDELKEALEHIDARGNTAIYDAVIGSLDHLKKGTRDKKVLIVITDGEDRSSRKSLEQTILEIQKSGAMVYTVGLLDEESRRSARKAKRALEQIANASGGVAFFPKTLPEVRPICEQIAQDIRSQYILGYYPQTPAQDGAFRAVTVKINPPKGSGKLTVRHRPGYYPKINPPAN